MKGGAFDYLVKPVDLERLSQVLDRAFEAARLMNVPAVLPADDRADRIVGRSPVMQEMCKAIGRVAPQDVNVLILGESGTGKELVARALYQHSQRADRPFLAINCAAIPETLLESELFGHEKGAFTGADRRRIGKFEQCDGGTLFLDEIGDMTPALQAKMLRVLQDQRFERVGGNETIQTNVRILAATNQDLEKLIAEGRFRKDLYYRLKAVYDPACRRCGSGRRTWRSWPTTSCSASTASWAWTCAASPRRRWRCLQNYSWPGNVRELQGVVKQAMLNASGRLLLPEFLPEHLRRRRPRGRRGRRARPRRWTCRRSSRTHLRTPDGRLYEEVIAAVERVLLTRALRQTHGHQTQASELLGLSRATLRHKLRTLGVAVERAVVDEGKA